VIVFRTPVATLTVEVDADVTTCVVDGGDTTTPRPVEDELLEALEPPDTAALDGKVVTTPPVVIVLSILLCAESPLADEATDIGDPVMVEEVAALSSAVVGLLRVPIAGRPLSDETSEPCHPDIAKDDDVGGLLIAVLELSPSLNSDRPLAVPTLEPGLTDLVATCKDVPDCPPPVMPDAGRTTVELERCGVSADVLPLPDGTVSTLPVSILDILPRSTLFEKAVVDRLTFEIPALDNDGCTVNITSVPDAAVWIGVIGAGIPEFVDTAPVLDGVTLLRVAGASLTD
jgi:hypothetical protein